MRHFRHLHFYIDIYASPLYETWPLIPRVPVARERLYCRQLREADFDISRETTVRYPDKIDILRRLSNGGSSQHAVRQNPVSLEMSCLP